MSNVITLDDIRAAAEKKYGSLVIPIGDHKVELKNVLRMTKERRERLSALQEELGSEAEDARSQEEVMADLLTTLCATDGQAKKLLAEVGEDLAVMSMILEQYTDQTQAGEAEPSQS